MLATYLTYRELFDRRPLNDEVFRAIESMHSFHTVLFASRLNALFRHSNWNALSKSDQAPERFQYWAASVLLDRETKQTLEYRLGSQSIEGRPFIHPLQLLQVIRLALTIGHGEDDSRPDNSEVCRQRFGITCLMVNDLFLTEEEERNLTVGNVDQRRQQLMLQLLPSIEISNPTPQRNLLIRAYATYRVILHDPALVETIRNECGGLNIEREFEERMGIALRDWLSLAFGVQALWMTRSSQQLLDDAGAFLINRKTMLQNSRLNQKQIDDFFDALSMPFHELQSEVQKDRRVDQRIDLVPFKSKPFFLVSPDTYACIDFSFLAEKLHNDPYFLLANSLPETERWKVFNAWGFVFEAYVNWVLGGLNGRDSLSFYPDTTWEHDGRKSFDAVILSGKCVVVMEHKGGFLNQNARYSNTLENLLGDLQAKIGKGCKQLARDVASLFPEQGENKRLKDVPIPLDTAYVLPILVVQDLMLRGPFINYFLNQRFASELSLFKIHRQAEILPLTVMQITDLEDMVEMSESGSFDIVSFLHRRCTEDREVLSMIPEFIESRIPDVNRCESRRFQELFEKSSNEMCSSLFRESESDSAPTSS